MVGWGRSDVGQINVPALPPGLRYTAIAAGWLHSVGLRSDGAVIPWGYGASNLPNVPALPPGVTYTAVACGQEFSLALRSDGVLVAWGDNTYGQLDVPALPVGVRYTSMAAGAFHGLANRSDGVLVAWGRSNLGQTTVPSLPSGVVYTQIGCGQFHSLATRGTTIAPSVSTAIGLSVGSSSPPPAPGGLSVAGASSFANAVSAASFSGSGSGLTALNATNITSGTLSNALTTGTDAATPGTLVLRDSSGNFSGNVITATTLVGSLNGNATSATNTPQLNFQPASFYTNASNISAGTLANARTTGTNLNTASTLVLRDASGNFSAGTITAALNGNAATATNATQLNAQPASFYTNASNINAGTLADARLSANVALLSASNTFTGAQQTFSGASGISLTNGIIQKSGSPLTATNDLGLYSQIPGGWLRFVTNAAQFAWFSDSGIGTSARMILSASGNLSVTGTLSKGGGSFKIDHPLDPENKFLYHSFVESPDMMNVYNGNVVTDANGLATVTLPDYFEALNRDFRYQLTVIDENDEADVFIWAKVVKKISGNQFTIRSSRGGVEVSWQVTGVRRDAWAEKNRIPNSVDKAPGERGRYLHPEAFGQPASRGLLALPEGAEAVKRE